MLLGIGHDPLAVASGALVGSERAVVGSIAGSPWESERALGFSVLTGARPMIETVPLSDAQTAYDGMTSGAAKFRMVLTIKDNPYAPQR
ncbi:MAG TPA: hypothetical protein VM422_09170 [Amaricoccus sp.]|nr:hypothetical protein [Amaricoccus sp.]